MEKPRLGTLLVRREALPASTPVALPIVRSTTFELPDAAANERYNAGAAELFLYSRYDNPTVVAVEAKLAALEGAEQAALFASGLAAVSTTALALLSAGDELLASSAIYGGSYRLFRDHVARLGVSVRFVSPEGLYDQASYGPRTKLVYLETPINPTLRLLDLGRVAAAARARGVPTVVDATFATPVLLRPLEHGIDLVLHSATKFLAGHTDLLAGLVSGSRALVARISSTRRYLGGILDPTVAYELSRGLSTLEVRVRRQCATALRLAEALEDHAAVERVLYPGLASHPDAALTRRLLPDGGGAVLTLTVAGGLPGARRAFDRLRVIRRAASLGGVESLASIPLLTSHTGFSEEELRTAGVTPGMIRLSVGLEDPEDLLRDLLSALG